MKDTIDKGTPSEKEIDLLEVSSNIAISIKKGITQLFGILFQLIKGALSILIKLISLGIKSWKYGLIVIAIGIGISAVLYSRSDPYYISDNYAISQISGNQEIIQIINSITIPNDGLNSTLKNDLHLSPEVCNNIISIKASWLIDENNDGIADLVDYDNDYAFDKETDSLARRMTDRFNIRITVKDPKVTTDIQEALETFLFSHPFIISLNSSRIDNIKGMVNVYNSQAEVLDSLQSTEYFKVENTIQSLKIGEFQLIGGEDQKDKRLYHESIIELKEQVLANESTLKYNSKPIIFVGNFTNTGSRVNSITFYALKVALRLIPLALLLLMILKRKELDEIFQVSKFIQSNK